MPTLANQGSAALVQRACSVTVGIPGSPDSILIECGNGTGLDVSFHITRGVHATAGSISPQPNTCDLRIWGLTRNHRNALAKSTAGNTVSPGTLAKVIPAIITAGYAGNRTTLFSGELRAANFVTDGADKYVAEMTTGDGDQALLQARLNFHVTPGSAMQQVLQNIVGQMGVQPGNLQAALAQIAASPVAAQIFAKGATLKGSASEILADLCRSTGFSFSVQNGSLSFTPLNQPIPGTAILIDEQHGLIGNATVDTKGIMNCKTLMIPGVVPGAQLVVNAINVTGTYSVLGVETTGNTSEGSSDWGHSIDAQRLAA